MQRLLTQIALRNFTDNTDESVIKFTEKRLGAENVFTFPEVTPQSISPSKESVEMHLLFII